ncbi:glycoside hydrolase family 15 protein [Mycobacterium sp. EPa45]|uniref:glycoside hydrolase family 15 protein n=1 Tax=Mycobacterium sp. EPa45 TaxID=1545728 RepID=UPI0006419D50|nr:glycoside hydrolase family 15 protein [Mycobacterium sp. EPa45]AKK26952.1 glycoside hydrolase [Mycobacterium sp. EPa45]
MSGDITDPHVLREYALLADGHRGALIGPRGEISWMCAPRWDSDAVFAALIGGNGAFAITPRGRFVWGGHYEDGSLIWRSRWVTTDGITECREALAYPGDPHRLVLMRRIIAARGDACVTMTFAPASGFGRHGMTEVVRDDHGVWHAECGPLLITLHGAPHATITHDDAGVVALRCDLKLVEGRHHDIVVEVSDRPSCGPLPTPDALWLATENAWESVLPMFDGSSAARDARHSYAVLRGMTSPGGGMVAAATMSLPERAEQRRNYDYRYVWIRDQCYAGQAVALDGPHGVLGDAVAFVTDRLLADGPDLKPAYRVNGAAVPDECSLRLPGYPGGSDMLGNHAHSQFQLDVFGEALLLFAAAARHDHLGGDGYRAAAAAASAIADRWREPDAGVWELETRHWTHSRLTCVAGLRAIATHAPAHDAADFQSLADAILAASADCVHPSGRWQRAPDDMRVDAALLVPALRGAVAHDDPRTTATLRAVLDELEDDGFVYRFHHDGQSLAEAEGAFLLCGFWASLACRQQGDMVGAARYFERNRAACGPPGLFGEEYDVEQRQIRGNIPQAFVHALLIESSLCVATPPHELTHSPVNRKEPS